MWKQVICRFEIPHIIISDNRKQFHDNLFKERCAPIDYKSKTLHLFLTHNKICKQRLQNYIIIKGIMVRLGRINEDM